MGAIDLKFGADSHDDMRQFPREPVAMQAMLRGPRSLRFRIDVLDMSVSGFRATAAPNLEPGDTIWLQIPDMAGQEAQVVWRRHFCYGFVFRQPLYPAVLDRIKAMYPGT